MCGRFTMTASREALKEWFPLYEIPEIPPRYNIAPTQAVPVVRTEADSLTPEVGLLRWGLIPSWAQDPGIGNRLINARAETASEKPAFRSAFRKRRCLVLADGFYEWHKSDGRKQPYYLRLRDGRPFAFAGLWENWEKGDQPLETFTILTTDANDLIRPLHDRMPVILAPEDYERWLDPRVQKPELVEGLLRPYSPEEMAAVPISPRVNNPRNEGPDCVAPLVE